MQELSHVIEHVADTKLTESESCDALDQAAEKWAVFCLKTLRGDLLSRGLDVSKALAEFVAEMTHRESGG